MIEIDNNLVDLNLCEDKYLGTRMLGNLKIDALIEIIKKNKMSPVNKLLNSLDLFSKEELLERKISIYQKNIDRRDNAFYHEFELDEFFFY